jgi:hypothetical protein
MPANAIYVGRPSRWGNPFRFDNPWLSVALYADMVRGFWNPSLLCGYDDEVVDLAYKDRLQWLVRLGHGHPWEIAKLELAGHDLCCWCKPGDVCHADALIELANPPLEPSDA